MTRLSALLALCVVLLASSLAPLPSVAQVPEKASRFDGTSAIGGSTNTKFPGIAGTSNQVVAVGNPGGSNGGRDAVAWQKTDSATSFPGGTTLGDARGQADYANAAVAVNRFDNTFHAVWIDQDTDRIYYKSKPLNGSWSDPSIVVSGSAFRVFAQVGVNQEGRVFVAWSQDNRIRYTSRARGASGWEGVQTAGSITPIARPFVAGGPGNSAILVFGDGDGNIAGGIWNGNSFSVGRIISRPGGQYLANPTATVAPNGTYYISWRDANGRGVYYSERQSNGSWPSSRIAGGPIIEAAPIVADENNNISIMWTGTASGSNDVYYAFKPAGQPFGDIVRAATPGGGGLIANGSGSATLSTRAYGHGVFERFSGGGLETRYVLFSSDAAGACTPTVVLAGGAEVTTARLLTGVITPPGSCSPTQMRIGLNTQDNAAAPLQNYSGTFTVQVPESTIGLCTQTVNVRLVANGTEGGWASDTIKVDSGLVDAAVTLEPYGQSKDILANGPSTWDPRYVRLPQVTLNIADVGECAGLSSFTGGGFTNQPITASPFVQSPVTLPVGVFDEGPVTVPVTVLDRAGSSQTFRPSIIYDPADTDAENDGKGRPVWQAGSELAGNNSAANQLTILRTITFSGVKVTDNLFDPDGNPDDLNDDFWGVWLAVEYLGAGNPPANPDNTALSWIPVPVNGRSCTANAGCTFTVPVNLFSGLNFGPDTTKVGAYRVYARVLDGAGNPSVRAESTTLSLAAGYQVPSLMLPVISR